MKRLPAVLIILGSLTAGITSGYVSAASQSVQLTIQTAVTCTFLSEAETAGYLSGEKRNVLIDLMAASSTFKALPAGTAAKLRGNCDLG